MILKIPLVLALCVYIKDVSSASYSKVFVQSGPDFPVEYLQYPAPSVSYNPQIAQLTAPVGSVIPSNYVPCGAPCIYPGQVPSVAPGANIVQYQAPSLPVVVAPPKSALSAYDYSYIVYDELTGDHKAQREMSNGEIVRGSYAFQQPDGLIREVQYVADDAQGFNAVVKHYLPSTTKASEPDYKEPASSPEIKNEHLTDYSKTKDEGYVQDAKAIEKTPVLSETAVADEETQEENSTEETQDEASQEESTSKSTPKEESRHKEITPKSTPKKKSHHEEITPKSTPKKESNHEEITPKSTPKKESNQEEITPKSTPKKKSHHEVITPKSTPKEELHHEEISHDSNPEEKSYPEENTNKPTRKATPEEELNLKVTPKEGPQMEKEESHAVTKVTHELPPYLVKGSEVKSVENLVKQTVENSNVLVSYNDIVKCIQAAINGAQDVTTRKPTAESPLTYIILNKPC